VAYVLDDVQLAALIATSKEPGEYRILKESLRQEPYGIMFRKDDPAFKDVVDQTVLGLMKSGAIDELYAKWFTKPIPPNNINLAFPMPEAVRNAFRNPNNNGV
jgi:glutamate/aspartate transport system substrate-binding protein